MSIGALADDERLKLVLPQACCYCGARNDLAADHLMPRKRGGADIGDNLVWSCRSCNSSKCARDVLEWLAARDVFPPLLLRRYLKLAIEYAETHQLMEATAGSVATGPFVLAAVPHRFPVPSELMLWRVPLNEPAV
jgi:hypothetical protein